MKKLICLRTAFSIDGQVIYTKDKLYPIVGYHNGLYPEIHNDQGYLIYIFFDSTYFKPYYLIKFGH